MDASLTGLASLLGTIHNLYPQARVTSGYRGPDNPLTRRNPRSMHAMGSPDDPRAIDVAPIPGVSFDQYVSSIKQHGVPVAQAFDEAAHPFPWTTGPNWHIASGDAPVAQPKRKPMTLADIAKPDLGAQMPVGLDAQAPAQAPMTLADLSLPQGDIPQKKHSPFTAGNILGVLGDALMAYGGLQPQFGPNLVRQQDKERQLGFDREKLNAELAARREEALAKASEPPQFAQNADYFNRMSPEQKRAVLQYQDATNPITVSMPDGPHYQPRTSVKRIGDKTYYNIGGEWYEESN